MSDQLTAEIQAFKDEMSQLNPTSAAYEEAKAKLEAKEAELAAQSAQEELFSEFENIAVGELSFTLREMCASEQHYQLLSSWLQSREGDRAQKQAAIESSYKSQIEALEDQVAELDQYRKRALEYSDKLADMELRRDAAADELHTAQEENKRLAADNASLRAQLEAKAKPVATNLNTNLSEIAKQLHALKPAIYNKRWKLNERGLEDRKYYAAELAETGETIEIPILDIGKYRELSEEEALRFRSEREAEAARIAAEAAVQDSPLVVPGLTFPPSETEGEPDGLAEEPSGVVRSAVTRQEHESLVERVKRIEQEIAAYVGRGVA